VRFSCFYFWVVFSLVFWGINPAFSAEPVRLVTAGEKTVVKIGYVNMRPAFYTENGEAKGTSLDLISRALEGLDQPYRLVEYPIRRLYARIKSGETHACICLRGRAILAEHAIVGDVPVGSIRVKLYAVGKVEVDTLWDVFGESIIMQQGYEYSGLRLALKKSRKQLRLINAISHKTAFSMLKSGRAKYVLDYDFAAISAMEAIGMTGAHNIVVRDNPLYITVSKKAPEPEKLLELLESGTIAVWQKAANVSALPGQ